MQVMNDSVKYQILFHTEVFNSLILTLPIKTFVIFTKETFRNLISQEIAEILQRLEIFNTRSCAQTELLVLRRSLIYSKIYSFLKV